MVYPTGCHEHLQFFQFCCHLGSWYKCLLWVFSSTSITNLTGFHDTDFLLAHGWRKWQRQCAFCQLCALVGYVH
jgi:hypothetical protein